MRWSSLGNSLSIYALPALEYFVLMPGTHAAAGVFAVAAVKLLHNIPTFNHLAEGSKRRLRIVEGGVVAKVDVNLRGARSGAGVGKGDIARQVVDLDGVVRNRFVAPG